MPIRRLLSVFREVYEMKKTHLIGILIGLTITLSILPAVNAVGGIAFVSPTGETYKRGDTLVIEAISYADANALLQIKLGSTVTWADQVVGAFSSSFVYTMVIPSTWSGGTYTVYVKGDNSPSVSTTFYLSVPSGGGYTPPPSANFVLSDFSISPTTVEPDETVKISVKVTNTGTKLGTKTIKLTIDGVVEESEDVTLGVQESEIVSWNVKKTTPGTYSIDVNGLIGSFKVETEEGPEPEPPEPAAFILSNLVVSPSTVEPDETVTISVTVMNVGEVEGSYTVELLIDGVKVDEYTVTLDGGFSETVEFTVTEDTDGTYAVSIGELSDSFTVETPPPPPTPAEFELSNLVIFPTTVEIGEPVSVSVTVTNVGEEAGSYTAELLIDGSKVDEDTVTLVGGASDTVEFTGVSGEEGSHTVSVGDLSGSFTVEMPEGGVGPNWALYAVGGLAILGIAWVVYKQFLES
jgi:hypothetical protein